jgi:hypothetical protein
MAIAAKPHGQDHATYQSSDFTAERVAMTTRSAHREPPFTDTRHAANADLGIEKSRR